MDAETLFPRKFISAPDLQGQVQDVVIESVTKREIEAGEGEKPIISFRGISKAMRLNVVNTNTIIALYGSETDDWTGKAIAIYPSECDFQGKRVKCIRVKIDAPVIAGTVNGDQLSASGAAVPGREQSAAVFGGTQ